MPAHRLRFLPLSALFAALFVTSSCGSASTPTTPEPASVTQVFAGTLAVSGAAFYSFTTTQTGTISFQLTKVQRGGVDAPDTLSIGFGAPRGIDCTVSTSTTAAASTAALLTAAEQTKATYCVRVWDTGILASPVTFSVNINRPIQ